jgi:cytochrome P450
MAKDGWSLPEFWSLFRYEDIARVVDEPATFANASVARLGIRRVPLESDPPEHPQVRRLLMPLFAPKAMARVEPASREIAGECLDALMGNGGGDAVALVSRPMPTQVLLTWLGQPRSDWAEIKAWADASRPQRVRDEAHRAEIEAAEKALWDYSWAVLRDRQASPRPVEQDPVSAMLAGEIDGARLPEELAVGMVRLVLAAGHDSTSQAIGICIQFLAAHPEEQQRVRSEPGLLRTAIDEILRLESPVVAMPRTVTKPVELHGRTLEPGDRVMLNWASANRDEEAFEGADECRLDRFPNRHLAFGAGIHRCAGAPLARQELRVVLEELLSRTRAFGLAGEPTVQNMHQYGFTSIPLWVEPSR